MQDTIKSIKKIQHHSKRYDLQTKTHHNFYANSILVHNSIIELYFYNGNWNWSTGGMFHAEDANLSEILTDAKDGTEHSTNFMDLINFCINKQKIDMSIFTITNTYVFELTSPSNRIVTPYTETKLTFIGERDNLSDQELDIAKSPIAKHIPIPEIYYFNSIDEVSKAADGLTGLAEGYVLRGNTLMPNGSFPRQKHKSKEYIKCHHIRGENNFSYKQLFEVVQANESGEVEAYFPEVKKKIGVVMKSFSAIIKQVQDQVDLGVEKISELKKNDPLYIYNDTSLRKNYATWVNTVDVGFRKFMFYAYDENYNSMIEKFFREVSWKDYKAIQLKINNINLKEEI